MLVGMGLVASSTTCVCGWDSSPRPLPVFVDGTRRLVHYVMVLWRIRFVLLLQWIGGLDHLTK